jgi:Metallo-beta-lactamase superfamily
VGTTSRQSSVAVRSSVATSGGSSPSFFIHGQYNETKCGDGRVGWLLILRVGPLSIRTGPRRSIPRTSTAKMFDLALVGTSDSVPLAERNHPSLLVVVGGKRLLVDCGEGTQRQLLRSGAGFRGLERLLLTHGHFDHVLRCENSLFTGRSVEFRRAYFSGFGMVLARVLNISSSVGLEFANHFPVPSPEQSHPLGIVGGAGHCPGWTPPVEYDSVAKTQICAPRRRRSQSAVIAWLSCHINVRYISKCVSALVPSLLPRPCCCF